MNDLAIYVEYTDDSLPALERIRDHRAKPDDKLLILADNPENARKWALQHEVNRSDYFIITSPEHLRGVPTSRYPRVRIWSFTRNRNADAITSTLARHDAATATKPSPFR